MLIPTQPLPTTLEASPLGFLTTDWMGTKSGKASMLITMCSVQRLSTSMPAVFHWVRAASIPRLVKPMLDPLPLTPVCLYISVFCMPCLGDLSHHTCCIVLSPSSCSPWQSVQGSHTQNSFLSWVPSRSHATPPVPLNHFVTCASVLCSHGSSAAFSSTLWSSLPG